MDEWENDMERFGIGVGEPKIFWVLNPFRTANSSPKSHKCAVKPYKISTRYIEISEHKFEFPTGADCNIS